MTHNLLRRTEQQLNALFRMARHETADPQQLAILTAYYNEQLTRFSADQVGASKLLRIGVTPLNSSQSVTTLAALTNVAALVMSTPDAYTIH
jgi:hypothetical protein